MHFKPYIYPSDQVDQVISLVINVYAKFWTTDQFRIYQQAIWHEEMDESAVMNISDKSEKGVRFWGFYTFGHLLSHDIMSCFT